MQIEFDYTLDEMVDTNLRLLDRSPVANSWKWRDSMISGLAAGLVPFIFLPTGILTRIIAGCFGLVFGTAIYLPLRRQIIKRRLRKFYLEKYGANEPFVCQIELGNSGISTRQNGTQIIYAWEQVADVFETDDSIDLLTSNSSGIIVVRKRAFATSEEQQNFLNTVSGYRKLIPST